MDMGPGTKGSTKYGICKDTQVHQFSPHHRVCFLSFLFSFGQGVSSTLSFPIPCSSLFCLWLGRRIMEQGSVGAGGWKMDKLELGSRRWDLEQGEVGSWETLLPRCRHTPHPRSKWRLGLFLPTQETSGRWDFDPVSSCPGSVCVVFLFSCSQFSPLRCLFLLLQTIVMSMFIITHHSHVCIKQFFLATYVNERGAAVMRVAAATPNQAWTDVTQTCWPATEDSLEVR